MLIWRNFQPSQTDSVQSRHDLKEEVRGKLLLNAHCNPQPNDLTRLGEQTNYLFMAAT